MTPPDPQLLPFLGEAAYFWHYCGDQKRAAVIFDALTSLAPNDPAPHLGLAQVALAQADYRAALNNAAAAIRARHCLGESLGLAFLYRGDALLGLRRLDDAAHAWRRARTLPGAGRAADLADDRLARTAPLLLRNTG